MFFSPPFLSPKGLNTEPHTLYCLFFPCMTRSSLCVFLSGLEIFLSRLTRMRKIRLSLFGSLGPHSISPLTSRYENFSRGWRFRQARLKHFWYIRVIISLATAYLRHGHSTLVICVGWIWCPIEFIQNNRAEHFTLLAQMSAMSFKPRAHLPVLGRQKRENKKEARTGGRC